MTATNPAKIQLDTKEEILKPDTKLIKDLIAEGREKGFITPVSYTHLRAHET